MATSKNRAARKAAEGDYCKTALMLRACTLDADRTRACHGFQRLFNCSGCHSPLRLPRGRALIANIIYSYSNTLFSHHTAYPSCTNEQPVVMSSTGQPTSSFSTFQSIINAALADYTKQTGIDLTKTPFAETIELSNSPEAIFELLQERGKAFKEYREGDQRLIGCLSPTVKVLHAFSGILGEAVSLVSITYYPANRLT